MSVALNHELANLRGRDSQQGSIPKTGVLGEGVGGIRNQQMSVNLIRPCKPIIKKDNQK